MPTVVKLRARNPGRAVRPRTRGRSQAGHPRLGRGLFARHGFYGVTTARWRPTPGRYRPDPLLLRAKRELFDAVLLRRAEIINDERARAMTAYEAAIRDHDRRGVIAAFIDPVIQRALTGGQGWKNFLNLVPDQHHAGLGGEVMHRFFDPVVRQLIETLGRVLPTRTFATSTGATSS